MDISGDAAAIIEQAPQWNFAGDCALLELMKRISQNLEERAECTTHSLNEFETNVRRIDIALDNATNSLRSLQFGQQFVEYRVEEVDDDDFALPEELHKKPQLPAKSAQEMATEFVQNNLQMFRKNFEPVTIEVPDSDDDEDGAANTTTVYRAKNPYDAIPLPYIIGSKEWQEHKYAGLYDSAENSEDEQPEQFSSSSSDEQEVATTADKTTLKALPSDSSSLTSLPLQPPLSETPPSPPLPAVRPKAQPRPIISSQRNPHERDLFSALRASPPSDDPPSTSSSLNSSPAISYRTAAAAGLPRLDASLSSSSSSVSKARQSPPKLFDEPKTAPLPIATPIPTPLPAKEEAEVKPVVAASQIKRKPVNLFNDDEFNSFMSEIVDKVQSKSSANQTPAKTQTKAPTPAPTPAPVEPPPVANKLNLFDDSPPLSPIATPAHKPAQVLATPAKTLPTSLFDDNLDDDDDFLSSFTSKAKPTPQVTRTSLFDDDDDDDLDIDDIFAKKPKAALPVRNPIQVKTSLFDDDEEENVKDIFDAKKQEQPVAIPPKTIPKTMLFDDEEEDNVNDIFGASKPALEPTKQQEPVVAIPSQTITKTELFKDEVAEGNDAFGASKSTKQQQESKVQDFTNPSKSLTKTSLFDDDEKEDKVKDIFGAKQQTDKKELEIAKSSLFDDDDEDDNVNDIFGAGAVKSTTPIKEEQPKVIAKTSLFDDDEEEHDNVKDLFGAASSAFAPQKEQHKSLFDDLGDDDLFGTPKSSKNLFVSEIKAVDEEPPEDDMLPEVPKKEQPTVEAPEEKLEAKGAIPQANLFSDDFGDEETITKQIETATTSKIKTEHKEVAEESLPNPQTEPTINNEDVEFKNQDEPPTDLVLDDLFNNLSDTRDAAQAGAEQQQDPIISMVAEVSNKQPNNETQMTPPKSEDIVAAQQIMQNYSSLFSDEPPDDSEFFQSLGTSSLNSLSASKMFDNDHDFFEPSLPALPKTKEQPVEQLNSDYGGMRLFSDVPPEDDGEAQPAAATVQRQSLPATGGASTKRIHTIFYDDFSETARATPEKQLEVQTESKQKMESAATDVVDRSVPSNNSELKKPTSPVKKLQMPNININVKALLPGAGTLPKLPKKQLEEPAKDQVENETALYPKEHAKPTAAKQLQKTSSADAEKILQCVGKTRARGPARRPSTRRARQENYAKSLQEQHHVESSSSTSPSSNIPSKPSNINKAESKKAASTKQPQESLGSASFLESDDDADDALFGAVKKMTTVAPAAIPVALQSTQPPEDDQKPVDKPAKMSASFLDSDDEDSGFRFSPPTAAPAAGSQTDAKSKTKSTALKQVSFLDCDEEEHENAALFGSRKSQAIRASTSAQTAASDATSTAAPVIAPFTPTAASARALAATLPAAAPVTVQAAGLPKEPVAVKGRATSAALPSKKPTMMKSFLDSDDDDALFSSLAKPAPVAAAQPEKTVKIVKKVEKKSVKPTATPAAPKAIASKANTLFDDSDDDEDLFGGGKAKAAPTVLPTKPKAALFGDSDSEDEAPPKALSTKIKLPTKPSKSLFSDDEDDDDLFGGGGGGAKRAAVSSQAKPAQVAPRHPPKTSSSSSKQSKPGKQQAKPLPSSQAGNSDNPLADLLGP